MTDKEKLHLFLESIRPECLDSSTFRVWWETRDAAWKLKNSNFLNKTRTASIELYKRFNRMGNIYDEVRTDKEVIQLLKDAGDFAVEDWIAPLSGAEIENFASNSFYILELLSYERADWFVKIFAYWPEVEPEILDKEFGKQMKKMLLEGNGFDWRDEK